MKQILLTLLLFFACFGRQDATGMPGVTATGSGVQQDESVAQGDRYTWPGALPELERLIRVQTLPASSLKNQSGSGLGTAALDVEHWLQQGIARQVTTGQLCQASLSGIRIIFPFHYFW